MQSLYQRECQEHNVTHSRASGRRSMSSTSERANLSRIAWR